MRGRGAHTPPCTSVVTGPQVETGSHHSVHTSGHRVAAVERPTPCTPAVTGSQVRRGPHHSMHTCGQRTTAVEGTQTTLCTPVALARTHCWNSGEVKPPDVQ